jgi:hypothetical protein
MKIGQPTYEKVNEELFLDNPLHVILNKSKLVYRIYVILIANKELKNRIRKERERNCATVLHVCTSNMTVVTQVIDTRGIYSYYGWKFHDKQTPILKLSDFNPRTNYTDRATNACRRS